MHLQRLEATGALKTLAKKLQLPPWLTEDPLERPGSGSGATCAPCPLVALLCWPHTASSQRQPLHL